jgi:hypothetical protein
MQEQRPGAAREAVGVRPATKALPASFYYRRTLIHLFATLVLAATAAGLAAAFFDAGAPASAQTTRTSQANGQSLRR